MPTKKKVKKLDPMVERLLILILQARRARARSGIELDPRIEVATAPAPERAVIR